MKTLLKKELLKWLLIIIPSVLSAQNSKFSTIENFDDGSVDLYSYPGEDINSSSWALNSSITYNNSPYSLRLYGNTWKVENISPQSINSGDIWQVSAYIQTVSEIQGFGISDGTNELFWSFAGNEELEEDQWVPVYQGCFPEDQWNIYQLPVADDWFALYGYLPDITQIIYINDNDDYYTGIVYFDQIINITEDLPIIPEVSINFTKGSIFKGSDNVKSVEVQFNSEVIDPDSEDHDYYWDFGDGHTSSSENPQHTFIIEDDHNYTVILKVTDESGRSGQASCSIEVDEGTSSFPISLNFVGDIMMARNFEYPGGIIPTYGVEYIFEPLKDFLKDSADITIANLECPLTTHWEQHPTKSICFKGSPSNVDGLTYAGIDIVTLANNHILDYLYPGMQQTQSVLNNAGIKYSGAGADSYEAYQPLFYSESGINFAFLAASNRTGQYNNCQPYLNAGLNKYGFANLDEYNITKQINEVRDVSDLVITEWHCGYEYSTTPQKNKNINEYELKESDENYSPLNTRPDKYNREIRQYAIDQGADLVICHHPHIIQGFEIYEGKLIAHSLGNFVFDLAYPETFPSMILNTKVNESGFYEFSLIPVYIDDYIPQRAEGELGLHILDYLAQLSKDLDTYINVDREKIKGYIIIDTLNMEISETEFTDFSDPEYHNGNWISDPVSIMKEGSISEVNEIKPEGDYEFRLGRELLWFGNMEDEGCTLWDMNNFNESFCDTSFYEGNRSIQHIRDFNSPYNLVTNLEKKIICRSNEKLYSLSAYIKTLNAENVTIEIQYFDSRYSNYPIGQESIGVNIDGTTPWTLYHKELTIPYGTEFFDIRLNSNIPNSGTAYSWFDNVSIICWDDWNEYETGDKISSPNDYYFLQARSSQNPVEFEITYSELVFKETQTSVEDSEKTIFEEAELIKVYPNPFSDQITFINLSDETITAIEIYDIHGKLVKTISELIGEDTKITIDGNDLKKGIYFCKMKGKNQNYFCKIIKSK